MLPPASSATEVRTVITPMAAAFPVFWNGAEAANAPEIVHHGGVLAALTGRVDTLSRSSRGGIGPRTGDRSGTNVLDRSGRIRFAR